MNLNKNHFRYVAVAFAISAYPLFASEALQNSNQEQVQIEEVAPAPVVEEVAPAPVVEEAASADCPCPTCN